MFGDGIKQSTATTGTGNLTVTAVAGYPTLANVFAVGSPVSYTLLDSAGLFLEAGIGYLSDATTFVRARISATFVSSTYNSSNPSAVSLTGTTTLIGTPHAATIEAMMPTVDSVNSGVLRMIGPANRTNSTAAKTIASGALYMAPFLLRTGAPITSLIIVVTTAAAASSVAQLGIYPCQPDGTPGTLLASTTNIDVSTTGTKTASLSSTLTLPPGWYFVAYLGTGTPVVSGWTQGPETLVGPNPAGFVAGSPPVPVGFRSALSQSLPLPTNGSAAITATASSASFPPAVWMGL